MRDDKQAEEKGQVAAGMPGDSPESSVSRRDFLRIGATYGMTATLSAAALLGTGYSATALAQTAGRINEQRSASSAKHTLRLGTVYNHDQHDIQRAGIWDFVRDLEERTDGEIHIEVVGAGSLCAETVCMQRAMQGVIDITSNSTQNGASAAPWLNALDYPFMWQSSGQIYDFFFNPESERLFRKTYREQHGMEMLFTTAELRGVLMGRTFRDRDPVTSVGDLRDTRIRATATQFGQAALRLMDMNPVPVDWTETLDAMRSGLVDGMETWPGAASAFNMAPVVTKLVRLNFIPGTQHVAIRSATFEGLEGHLQDAVLESAYNAQCAVMYNLEAARHMIIGDVENPQPGTIYGDAGTQVNVLSEEALEEAEEMAHPERSEYNELRRRLDGMAGFNVYEELLPVARRFPADELAINVVPRRWWKSA